MDGGVMLLWLRYLKQLEMACASTPDPPPDGAESIKIKSEDEEWGESEAMPEQPSTPSSGGERASASPASPASAAASPAASPSTSPPRLRLNTRLATDPARAPLATALKLEPPAPLKREPPTPSPPAAPPYMCAPCGIRYSSLSTLTAHREHYCSARRAAPPASPPDDAPPTGKQYACAHCSYSADKKVSLNRHMRMHAASPPAAPVPNGDADAPPPPDRYCSDCDIRFSSVKTFRAHKTHYCSTRQVVKSALARGGSSGGSAPASPRATPPAPLALALPTDPILVVPYALLRSASALPGAALPHPDAPCFLLPDGSFRPLGRALPGDRDRDPDVLKAANRPRDATAPLDLSVRRAAAVRPDDQEKENRAASPEHIVCAPELPPSPATPSPRRSPSPSLASPPKRRRRESAATPGPEAPRQERSPPTAAPRLPAEPPVAAVSPQVLVKQGSAKCKECNIVFCQYENYRIHKRHYCAAGGEERTSPAPEPGPPQYRQLICLACGIHFSSLDNLTTHQAIYCTKRAAGGAAGAGAAGAWRCPCCDAVAASAAAAQRHLEAHAGLRAFRCTICRYRGNTLRGMRTHIRMHFPKKPQDLQEESYISCVMEDDSRESTSPSSGSGNGSERIHRCGSCAYSSTYRGNVVRHARIVHGADEPDVEEAPTTPTPTPPTPTLPQIKKEEPDTEPEETPNYCKSCDISFKYVKSYKAHKQFYCPANNPDAAANNNVTPVVRITDTPV